MSHTIIATDTMSSDEFPTECYLDAVVRFLKVMKYDDNNYTQEERTRNLHYAYTKAANHFAQPKQQELIKASPKRLQASLQTIVAMVVYAWVRVDPEVMADLSIHYTYMLLLDDSKDEPDKTMETFYNDLLAGRPQKNHWWQMVNEQFPTLLEHYGPYCKLNLIRSTTDCMVEISKSLQHVTNKNSLSRLLDRAIQLPRLPRFIRLPRIPPTNEWTRSLRGRIHIPQSTSRRKGSLHRGHNSDRPDGKLDSRI